MTPAFLQVDGTAIVQLVNFAIFFVLVSVLFLRPVRRAIQKRRDYINGLARERSRYEAQAASLRAEAESLRAGALRTAAHEIWKTRSKASDEAAAIATEYDRRRRSAREEAWRTAAAEMEQARADEERLVRELADLILERVIPEAAPFEPGDPDIS